MANSRRKAGRTVDGKTDLLNRFLHPFAEKEERAITSQMMTRSRAQQKPAFTRHINDTQIFEANEADYFPYFA